MINCHSTCNRQTVTIVAGTVVATLLTVQFFGFTFLLRERQGHCQETKKPCGIVDAAHINTITEQRQNNTSAALNKSFMDDSVHNPDQKTSAGHATQIPSTARSNKTNPILAIPVMFRIGCDTQLPEIQRNKLEVRASAMHKILKEHNLPAQPATFCHQEKLEDPRPTCENNQSQRVDNSIKTLNLAKNFLQAFLTCSKQKDYKVCLIMEDDTILHPNFTAEANALMDDLPADWQLVHLCIVSFTARHKIPYPRGSDMSLNGLEDWKWFPQPNVEFGEKRCQGLGCNTTTQKCALASLKDRYWVKDEPFWGGQPEVYVPCISWIGGPQAYLVKPAEAAYLAKHVSKPIYCGTKLGPNDLALSYQSRYSFKRHHYMARDPQLCFEPGNDEKQSSFSNKT